MSVARALQAILQMLTDASAEPWSHVHEKSAHLYVSDRAEHDRVARDWVLRYARWDFSDETGSLVTLQLFVNKSPESPSFRFTAMTLGGIERASSILDSSCTASHLKSALAAALRIPSRRVQICLAQGSLSQPVEAYRDVSGLAGQDLVANVKLDLAHESVNASESGRKNIISL